MAAALVATLATLPAVEALSFRSLLEHGTKSHRDKTYFMYPKREFLCMEGQEQYLKDVLARFKNSNMAYAWNSTGIKEGKCIDHEFEKDPNPIECFPNLTVWLPKDQKTRESMDSVGLDFVKQYRAAHPDSPEEPDVKCMTEDTNKAMEKIKAQQMSYISPKRDFLCLEGEQSYLKQVLVRFQDSNMNPAWKNTLVKEGTCADHGFEKDPSPIRCFPNSSVWLPKDPDTLSKMDQIGMEFVADYRKNHPDAPELPNVKCMTKAASMSFIRPKRNFMCIEGADKYLAQVLVHFKDSNMAPAWNDTKIQEGTCGDQGFERDPNPIGCFPRATVWIPKDAQAQQNSASLSARFIQQYRRAHPEAPEVSNVKCMTDDSAQLSGTFMIRPARDWLCIEGNYDDLNVVLEHLKESNMLHAWKNSTIKKGQCSLNGFEKDPNPVQCFPKSSMWLPKNPDLRKNLYNIGMDFVKQYRAEHKNAEDFPNMHCIPS